MLCHLRISAHRVPLSVIPVQRSLVLLTALLGLLAHSALSATDFFAFPLLTIGVGTLSITALPLLMTLLFERPFAALEEGDGFK